MDKTSQHPFYPMVGGGIRLWSTTGGRYRPAKKATGSLLVESITQPAYRAVEDLEGDDAANLGEQGEDDQHQEHPVQGEECMYTMYYLYSKQT